MKTLRTQLSWDFSSIIGVLDDLNTVTQLLLKRDLKGLLDFSVSGSKAFLLCQDRIVTFNGISVDIPVSKCNYLLARDIEKTKFAILFESKGNNKGYKLTFLHAQTIVFDISKKGKATTLQVLSKKKPIDLPFEKRRNNGQFLMGVDSSGLLGDGSVVLTTYDGIKMKIFPRTGFVQFTFSNQWHGRVAGLLGLNDYESVTDLRSPKGEIYSADAQKSKNNFVLTWKLDPKCKVKFTERPSATLQTKKACSSLKRLSHRRESLSGENLYDHCLSEITVRKQDAKSVVCNLRKQYVSSIENVANLYAGNLRCKICPGFTPGVFKVKKYNFVMVIPLNYEMTVKHVNTLKTFAQAIFKKRQMLTLLTYDGLSKSVGARPQIQLLGGEQHVKNLKTLKKFLGKFSKVLGYANSSKYINNQKSSLGKALKLASTFQTPGVQNIIIPFLTKRTMSQVTELKQIRKADVQLHFWIADKKLESTAKKTT